GFPVDLTADVARERGLGIDQARFEAAMEEQRRRSQEASKFGSVDPRGGASFDARTLFEGYEGLAGSGRVLALLKRGAQVDALGAGEQGEVVLDRTPFYAEAGGQVGDAGELTAPGVRFVEIGRASCRERGWMLGAAVALSEYISHVHVAGDVKLAV